MVNHFSNDLNEYYAAIYRPINHVIDLMSKYYCVESVDRIYPDSIESKYGTKQFYIIGKKK